MIESVSPLAFLFVVCRKKPRREEESLGSPELWGWESRPGRSAQNVPPFLATGTQKQTQQGKSGEAGEGTEQEGTGPAELSSFSGPATNSRTRESVWTAQLPEPFRPMLEPRLGLPALRGATRPSFIPGGKG